jgi:hypothetical protein
MQLNTEIYHMSYASQSVDACLLSWTWPKSGHDTLLQLLERAKE